MNGEPQAGGDGADAPPRLFDQDKASVDAVPTGARRQTGRTVGSTLSPVDTPMSPAGPDDMSAEQSNGASPPQPYPGQPLTAEPPAHWPASIEPAAAGVAEPGAKVVEPTLDLPADGITQPGAGAVIPTLSLPAADIPPAGPGVFPAAAGFSPAVAGAPLPATGLPPAPLDFSPALVGIYPPAAGLPPAPGGISPAPAGISGPAVGVPPAIPGTDLRRPLVRPVPGQGRAGPRPRKTEKRPTFRGTRRPTDRIGIWRKLQSFVELVIVVVVLGALLAAVIGAIIGAIVVALQKALNG